MSRNEGLRISSGGAILGFPTTWVNWCNGYLKRDPLRFPTHKRELVQEAQIRELYAVSPSRSLGETGAQDSNAGFSDSALTRGAKTNIVQYLGIAADEPERIARHSKPGVILPLVEAGWDEAYCRQWCEENDLLSPIYTTATRGGCWFCHNQGLEQLRLLRKNYPDLWQLLLKWDLDSPVTFKSDGHTVHDYDRRFQLEEEGEVPMDRRFRWKMLDAQTEESNENN